MYTYTAFEEFGILAQGPLEEVVLEVKKRQKLHPEARILVFSDSSGHQLDFDLSGTEKETLERLKIYSARPAPTHKGAGRPKLGVVPREISLLPGHWEWLSNQSGGASSTIRQLIDEKIKNLSAEKNKVKTAQEVTYRFLSALAGDLPHFEEAIRYLYRKDKKNFLGQISSWKKDLVNHSIFLAKDVFDSGE